MNRESSKGQLTANSSIQMIKKTIKHNIKINNKNKNKSNQTNLSMVVKSHILISNFNNPSHHLTNKYHN